MDVTILLLVGLIVLVVILPPILFVHIFLYVQKKLGKRSAPRRAILYLGSIPVWLASLVMIVILRFPVKMDMIPLMKREMAAPAQREAIPRFPWPPPAASSFMTIPLMDFLDRDQPSLDDANRLLRSAFESAGYFELSYYAVPDGFALVSRVERIEPDGRPMAPPHRWEQGGAGLSSFSLVGYVRSLFLAPPGYYRLIVFLLTPHPFAQSTRTVSRETAESWLRYGANALPEEISREPYSERFICTALIYEFEKYDTRRDAILRQPGRLSAMAHIEKSEIWRNLQ